MPEFSKKILLTGMPLSDADRYLPVLNGLGFQGECISDPNEAGRRLRNDRFDAVVSGYPLKPGGIGALLTSLRFRGSVNAGAVFVLLASGTRLRGAASLVGRGVNKAISNEESPTVLGIVLQRMIEVSQPMAERRQEKLKVVATVRGQEETWVTENISGGGMLIGTDHPPALDSTFPFTLEIPDGELAGQAKVVRHVVMGREAVDGFGARFLWFHDDGQSRLLKWLREAALANG
ncbi:MAG: PilZ domain-containing protein [Thermoanaerobaculales bacterium]|nr:PilZ domain-containing protein [Thermoanaerobaculales bacterium]